MPAPLRAGKQSTTFSHWRRLDGTDTSQLSRLPRALRSQTSAIAHQSHKQSYNPPVSTGWAQAYYSTGTANPIPSAPRSAERPQPDSQTKRRTTITEWKISEMPSSMSTAWSLIRTLLLAFFVIGCNGAAPSHAGFKILSAQADVLRPYVWFYAETDSSDAGFQQQLDYGDPLRITTVLLQDWLAHRDIDRIHPRIEEIISKWNLQEPGGRLNYTFAYGRLSPGWYSAMDSWSFPMLLVGLWQETGRTQYKALADKLIAQASRSVSDGGTVWRSGDRCWFSEYAWDGMHASDEYYVLNGHLYALQSLRMLALALGDKTLDDLYRCGVRATKIRSIDFLNERPWPLYMLNPRTINQTHYVIYETMQFDALSALDKDPYFPNQAGLRRSVLQEHFPVYLHSHGGSRNLIISAIGAPHPYQVDTYALELECADGTHTEKYSLPNPTDTRKPVIKRAMLSAPTRLDPEATTCRLTSEYLGQRTMLYESRLRPIYGDVVPGVDIATKSEALFDAYLGDGGRVIVDPSRRHSPSDAPSSYLDTQGRLTLTPTTPIAIDSGSFIGFEFDADGPLKIGVMINSKGRDFFRYYPETRAGNRTLVLLSPLGFDDGDRMETIDRITFFFYTDKQERQVEMTPRRLAVFRNQVELYEYFNKVDPNFYTE